MMNIRIMEMADLDSVVEIEEASFSEPWLREDFEYSLKAGHDVNFVSVIDGEVAGYLCLRISLDCADITNVAVRPSLRGNGVGKALMENVMKYVAEHDIANILLEVRVSNKPAIALYEGFDFKSIGTRKKYYSNPVEDAMIMQWN